MNLAVQLNVFKILRLGKKVCRSEKLHLFDGDFPSKRQLVFSSLPLPSRSGCQMHDTRAAGTRNQRVKPLSQHWAARRRFKPLERKTSCRLERKSPSKRCHFLLLRPFLPKRKILNTLNWTAKFTNVYLYNLEINKRIKKPYTFKVFSKWIVPLRAKLQYFSYIEEVETSAVHWSFTNLLLNKTHNYT